MLNNDSPICSVSPSDLREIPALTKDWIKINETKQNLYLTNHLLITY